MLLFGANTQPSLENVNDTEVAVTKHRTSFYNQLERLNIILFDEPRTTFLPHPQTYSINDPDQ